MSTTSATAPSDSTAVATTGGRSLVAAGEATQYVSIMLGDQLCGIPVLLVHDVLGPQKITRIPLAPPEVAGSLNLRGRIVTAIDVRQRLSMDPRPEELHGMSVVVEHGGELYSLMVDEVGEVLSLDDALFEPHPPTMAGHIREVSTGIHRLKDRLLVVLDVSTVLQFATQ